MSEAHDGDAAEKIWTREAVLEWLEDHGDGPLILRQRATALRVAGVVKGVEELDACSAHYQECELLTEVPNVEVMLSFHRDRLSVHLLLREPSSGEIVVSLPTGIPYDELSLVDPDEVQAKADFFSPYELL
jgi:hypothetical protein